MASREELGGVMEKSGSLSDKGLGSKEREEGSRQMEQYVQKLLSWEGAYLRKIKESTITRK